MSLFTEFCSFIVYFFFCTLKGGTFVLLCLKYTIKLYLQELIYFVNRDGLDCWFFNCKEFGATHELKQLG